MKLKRYDGNPILGPVPGSTWQSACNTNPAAWYDGKKVHLLFRGGPDDNVHRIYFGLAESEDGFHFRRVSDEPVFGPSDNGFDGGAIEDPRIIQFGDTYFVTYAARMYPPGPYWKKIMGLNAHNPTFPEETPLAVRWNITRSGLAATKDFKTWHRFGPITSASVDNRDAIIFPEKIRGRFFMLHRPGTWTGKRYGCEKPSIWISSARDMLCWKNDHLLAQPVFDWESQKIGGSAPPIKTDKGWLTLYHGVDSNGVYRTGAMMLDLKDPRHVLARTRQPILEPEMDYEKKGIVPNVVFPCGNVVINGTLFVYYGGADKVCAVATAPLKEMVDSVMSDPWND